MRSFSARSRPVRNSFLASSEFVVTAILPGSADDAVVEGFFPCVLVQLIRTAVAERAIASTKNKRVLRMVVVSLTSNSLILSWNFGAGCWGRRNQTQRTKSNDGIRRVTLSKRVLYVDSLGTNGYLRGTKWRMDEFSDESNGLKRQRWPALACQRCPRLNEREVVSTLDQHA